MIERFQALLGHEFADAGLLEWSLTHRSHTAESEGGNHNERLEFLGDAVLQLVVTDFLFGEFPDLPEGEMAKIRASSVSRQALAGVARGIELGAALYLGRGEEMTGGRDKDSILADGMEAVLAAVYLDGGIGAARGVIERHWVELVRGKAAVPGGRDFKTRLQEALAQRGSRPIYRLEETGPDHDKMFAATVEANGVSLGEGVGGSKKAAQQAAAEEAIRNLEAAGGTVAGAS